MLMFWSVMRSVFGVFFFFQAEDGIRDTSVTGVQTCALPILHEVVTRYLTRRIAEDQPLPDLMVIDGGKGQLGAALDRSEERRVGKEWRCRRWRLCCRKRRRASSCHSGRDMQSGRTRMRPEK